MSLRRIATVEHPTTRGRAHWGFLLLGLHPLGSGRARSSARPRTLELQRLRPARPRPPRTGPSHPTFHPHQPPYQQLIKRSPPKARNSQRQGQEPTPSTKSSSLKPRQAEANLRPRRRIPEPDPPAVGLDDRPRDRQPQPRRAVVRRPLDVRFEDPFALIRVDPAAAVGDLDLDAGLSQSLGRGRRRCRRPACGGSRSGSG